MSPAEQTPRRMSPLHPSARAAPRPRPPRPPPAGSAAATGRAPPQLPSKARQTQPSEPILLTKLRIQFADFPYLHCSIDYRGCSPWRPAAVVGTAGCQCNPLPRIFTGPCECTGRRRRCTRDWTLDWCL